MSALSGRVAIVTGSSSGIGAYIAEHLASLGVRLTITARGRDQLEHVRVKCISNGIKAEDVLIVVGDVSETSVRNDIVDQTIETFGQIDYLVNNTGIVSFKGFRDISEEEFDQVMNVNVKSAQFLSIKALPHLINSKGNIVNISSVAGAMPVISMSTYCMSKATMNMMTKCMAADFARDDVRVNAICPGCIDTPANATMPAEIKAASNPLHKIGAVEDVANMVSYILSPTTGRYITGACIDIDGGSMVVNKLTDMSRDEV